MINSMTGFGIAETQCDQWVLRVEMRSVNRKELQVTYRLPESFYLKESELQKLVEEKVQRGHVNFRLTCTPSTGEPELLINEEHLRSCISRLKAVAKAEGIPFQADLASLVRLPGVLKNVTKEADQDDSLWPQVLATARTALEAMVEMRRAEGKNLLPQLEGLCSSMEGLVDSIELEHAGALAGYRDRLRERVNKLLEGSRVSVDDESLAREVAIYADRSDVSEEIERLRSHLKQCRQALQGEDVPVGRKLEFLGQEMLREAGTMAAKIPTGPQVVQVLELKSKVDQLREQVRNVE